MIKVNEFCLTLLYIGLSVPQEFKRPFLPQGVGVEVGLAHLATSQFCWFEGPNK